MCPCGYLILEFRPIQLTPHWSVPSKGWWEMATLATWSWKSDNLYISVLVCMERVITSSHCAVGKGKMSSSLVGSTKQRSTLFQGAAPLLNTHRLYSLLISFYTAQQNNYLNRCGGCACKPSTGKEKRKDHSKLTASLIYIARYQASRTTEENSESKQTK